MINLIPTALTHFGRAAVVARRATGETYSDIQMDAFEQRDATIDVLFDKISAELPEGTYCDRAEHGIEVNVANANDMDSALRILNRLVQAHGQLFHNRGCKFVLQNEYMSATTFELIFNTDHA